jgi:hypothetical protein
MRKRLLTSFTALAAMAAFVACGGSDDTVTLDQGTVVTDVAVVDTRTGQTTAGQAVVIEQGRITRILRSDRVRAVGAAVVVDGQGKYLVPGYLDMHTHALPAAVLQQAPAWPLLLANGITGIREMAGAPPLIAAARQYNAARAAGTLDAPEVLTVPGAPVSGAATAAQGIAAVQATQAMGGQFVKVVAARPDALEALLAEAQAQRLTVSGHLSPGLSALDTANSGWKSLEHLGGGFGIQLDCADDQAAIRTALLAGQGSIPPFPFPADYTVNPFVYSAGDAPFIDRALDTHNAATCTTVAGTLVQKGVWQVPTLLRLRAMLRSDDADFSGDPDLQYVDPTTRALWTQVLARFNALPPAVRATFARFSTSYVDMLKVLRQRGVAPMLVTGTDLGGLWIVPGFSLHREFRELANAGFTPLEILQATTLNGARFLGRESTMGTVEVGRNADLVLLEADPLADVAHLSKIAGVFNAGKYFSKDTLDAMKAGIARAQAVAPLRDVSSVIDTSHTH